MKIAIFHELHAGGARRSVNEFGKRLKKSHQVDLYYVDESHNSTELINFTNVTFYKFIPKSWSGQNWKVKLYKDTIELFKLYLLHRKISKDIDDKKYNLVLIEPSRFTQAPFLLRLLKTRKIYYCQEPLRMVYEKRLDIEKELALHKYLYEKLNRFIRKNIDRSNIKKANILLANSKFTQGNIKSAYGLSSIVCYMGVDTNIFKPEKIKKDIDVLFIGSYALDDGSNILKTIEEQLKGNVKIKFLASEKQWITDDLMLRRFYCRSKIVLAIAYNEPFGLIPLEAMACGVPIVAVDEGGYRESVVNDKTGYLLSRDGKVLAEKIEYLLNNSKLREIMGIHSRNLMRDKWEWDKVTEKLEDILSKS